MQKFTLRVRISCNSSTTCEPAKLLLLQGSAQSQEGVPSYLVGKEPKPLMVSEYMSESLDACEMDDTIESIIPMFERYTGVPVLDSETRTHALGVVSEKDGPLPPPPFC